MKAGLIDEMELHVVPLLLGRGSRLFENMDARQTGYECVRIVNSPAVTPLQISANIRIVMHVTLPN